MGIMQANLLSPPFGWVAVGILVVLGGVLWLRSRRGRGPGGSAVGASPAGRGAGARASGAGGAAPDGAAHRTRGRGADAGAPASARSFADVVGTSALCDAIAERGWQRPTPVQGRAIPLVREGRDVIAAAPRGSGGTGAYLIPALDRQADREGLHTLVLVPTRDAVERVAAEARALAARLHLWIGALHAGEPAAAQVRDLRAGFDVLIATPGRLLEHLEAGHVDLSEVELLVLDEADRLLEAVVRPRVEKLLEAVPAERQALVFATAISEDVEHFARRLLRDPVRVETTSSPAEPAGADAANALDAADRVTGTVKWFSDTKGFGFITIEDGEKDCFVHYSAILGDGYRSLQEGDRVAFRVVPSPKGPEAANVTKL